MASRPLFNAPAQNVPYFVPQQYPPAGTAFDPQPDGKPIPSLFKPLRIRGVEFQNRVFLAPLGQYSSENGVVSPWQLVHLGGILTHGPGLTFTEATAVLPEGRATPNDAGIWTDEQAAAWGHVVQFAHSQNQKIGIQLAHAGRKASSTVAPWVAAPGTVSAVGGGWPDDVWGPTEEPFQADYPTPKALTKTGIARVVKGFVDAAKQAVRAGFDVIEIHGAHGFLISSFYAPSNTRTDEYGGSFENRVRLAVEVVDAVRSVIPPTMPLFFRVSATDWLEDGQGPRWRLEDTVCLSRVLVAHDVDFIDVSSGGLSSSARVVPLEYAPGYQVPFAAAVKAALGDTAFVGAVGAINEGKLAQSILDEGKADVVLVGRMFQKNPGFVWKLADDLGVELHQSVQIGWPFQGRAKKAADKNDYS
ncbi:FMN-linked oxidoreductase [Polyporus arcularius HHB13444]|uniref:FMN-linked oxidoreductase n=1 Tax=Polyporus arcularius HHB13444 TaxID=1314778 RepID=A0A5C3PGG5_9APHY|nr:FMN-linked oxidoreductase [Polyporus arcularius HHB13444]